MIVNNIIVLEIYGFQIPNSMIINYRDKRIYLYPGDYIERLKDIKKELKYINSSEFRGITLFRNEKLFQIEVGFEKSSYIVCNFELDLNKSHKNLYNEIYDFFRLFLQVNWVITDFLLNIKRIFIFKKKDRIYKLIRVIYRKLRISAERNKFFNLEIEDYEGTLQEMVSNAEANKMNKEIIGLFYELTYSKNARNIATKVIYFWNYLEHLGTLYARVKNQNLMINQEKFEKLKQKLSSKIKELLKDDSFLNTIFDFDLLNQEINTIINRYNKLSKLRKPLSKKTIRQIKDIIRNEVNLLIKDTDILASGYNKEKIFQVIINQINNFPSVFTLINILAEATEYNISNDEKNLIFYMHKARNHYFHESLNHEELYQILRNEINLRENKRIDVLTLREFYELINKFEKFLEKLTFHILKFPLDLKDKKSSFSAGFIKYNERIHTEETSSLFFNNLFSDILKRYSIKNQYHNLLKLIKRTTKNYEANIRNFEISGVTYSLLSLDDFAFISVRCTDAFSAIFKINGRIEFTQINFGFILYLKDKEFKFDSILEFEGYVDIDAIFNRFSLETDLLDFKINAEKSAKKNPTMYKRLKNSIIYLPIDFNDDIYFKNYFSTPHEFIESLDNIPLELDYDFTYVVLSLEKINELKKFKNIIGMQVESLRREEDHFVISYYQYLGRHPNNYNISLWSIRKELRFNPSKEFCYTFPFITGTNGAIFFTNSPDLLAIHYLIFCTKYKLDTQILQCLTVFQFYIKLLYDIHKENSINLSLIEKLKNYKNEKLELKIENPEDIELFQQYSLIYLNLLIKICIYPQIKTFLNLNKDLYIIKTYEIDPFINSDFKGAAWFSFALTVILYSFQDQESNLIDKINDIHLNKLFRIVKQINGKPLSIDFFNELFSFLNDYIIKFIGNLNK